MDIEREIELIKENTVDIISEKELLHKLKKSKTDGRRLIVKYGADPSAPDIHLGHTVPLHKLRQLQELGHQVVFIIGDFTARIGDPSGASKTRPGLKKEHVRKNAMTYQKQIFRILDKEKTKVVFNSTWCEKMKLSEVIKIASNYTVARMLERDDFSVRLEKKEPIGIHEFLYPLLQAYDSIYLKADLEVGGTDQRFNFIVARNLQRDFGQEPEVLILLPILEGTDGKQKMSKSLNNYIGIEDSAPEMYGKIMSIPDEILPQYYRLLLGKESHDLSDPYRAKKNLAKEITSLYHGEEAGGRSEETFQRIFARKELPEQMPEVEFNTDELKEGRIWVIELLIRAKLAQTRNEARRLIRHGGIKVDGKPLGDAEIDLPVKDGMVISSGKRHFARIKMEENHG